MEMGVPEIMIKPFDEQMLVFRIGAIQTAGPRKDTLTYTPPSIKTMAIAEYCGRMEGSFMNVVCKVRCSVVLALCASISAGTQADTAIAKTAVLTVTGQISETNVGNAFTFDMTALAALPQHSFTTHTLWHPESHTFTGPLLRDVLSEVGAQGHHVEAIALNGYSSTIPIEDSMYFDVIIARLQDGEPMRVRDKGPLFILYPFDEDEVARSQIYYGRSVWQLKSINVE